MNFFGKLIRLPLKLIPPDTVMPIILGPLKGKKWIVGSGVHGYWLGTYEKPTQKHFTSIIKKGDVVFDIGANVGFYSLLSSILVGEQGKVVAFEPFLKNIAYLKSHIKLNNIKNIHVIPYAVSKKKQFSFFKIEGSSSMGHLSETGDIKVKSVNLDLLIHTKKIPVPNLIKIDVEGSEYDVFLGARTSLKRYHPTIILSTHGKEIHKKCCLLLKKEGYHLTTLNDLPLNKTTELLAVYNQKN